MNSYSVTKVIADGSQARFAEWAIGLQNRGASMATTLRNNHSSSLCWRVIHVACAVAVCSFILFDVLDLDGSNFPLKPNPTQSAVLVATGVENTDHIYLSNLTEPWSRIVTISLAEPFNLFSLRFAREFRYLTLDSARRRGYRTALPRSSTSDPSLPA